MEEKIPAVVLEKFSKTFVSSGKTKKACTEIDFEANFNEITGIIGENGAGKSTLIKTICGIQCPTSGSVSVLDSEDFTQIRKSVSLVPEVPELEESLTVKALLYFEQQIYSTSRECLDEAVKICELEDVLDTRIKTLSKGFRQRVSLAKALCHNPKVLVLDEFSSGLDPLQNARLKKHIKKISKKITVILSSHRTEELADLCDKIYFLSKGKVIETGTVEEVLNKWECSTLEEAFIKLSDRNAE